MIGSAQSYRQSIAWNSGKVVKMVERKGMAVTQL